MWTAAVLVIIVFDCDGGDAEVYKKSRIWSDHRWRKFGHGIVLVQHGNSLRSLVGVAQRLQKLIKVDIFSLKMIKINLPPSNLKISNFLLDLDIKHLFWACWIEKTCMEVTMWVGGRGAPWGYRSGTKLDKLQGLMEVVVKNDENGHHLFWGQNVSQHDLFCPKNDISINFGPEIAKLQSYRLL